MIRRGLSPEERALWDKVRRSVRPIGPRPPEPEEQEEKAEESAAGAPTPQRDDPAAAARPSTVAPQPPLAPLEPKARRKLARGSAEPDERLDLHGMRQASAYQALGKFLAQAQARGARTVLVITGKGREGGDGGVLRQVVPRWLAEPAFRRLVVGFEPAARRHGGDGAFYVRLRRGHRPG